MVNFRATTFLFFLILLTMNILRLAGIHVPYYFYGILIAAYFGFSVFMSFFTRSGFHMKAYCSADTREKVIALTFDDGPDPAITPLVLDHLKQLQTPATFFCIGKKIKENEDLISRMDKEGHLVATHSFSHAHLFDLYSPRRMRKELNLSAEAVLGLINKWPLFFRPPYGVINPMVRAALKGTGFHVIGFSNRAWDTSSRESGIIIKRILNNLKPGDVVLLHDTIKETAESLPDLIEKIKEKGYRIVALDKLLNLPCYET
jgi:peptidoglycan-N-acetylglucosamine deacetylase